MKRLTKRLLSVILSILMVITVIPASIIPSFAESDSDTLLEVGSISYAGWAADTYNEYSVNTNGTDGDIIIVFTPQKNNWSSAGNNLLSINGVSVIAHGGTAGSYKLGSTDVAANFTARVITVTVNVTTGDATIVDTAGNSGTANVGAIGETFTLKINQDNTNSWTLTSLVVTQAKGASGDSSDTSTLLEVGAKSYGGWVNGTTDEYTVETNKTDGDITIVFTPQNNNWQTEGNNLLSVNGVSLISTCGTNGNAGYYLGTTAVKTWDTNVITAIINPTTGAATISDAAGNTGTTNVGTVGESFVMVVNHDNHNSWTLSSIVVTQVVGEGSDSPVSNTLYTNSFDSAEDVARGTCGNENTVYDENKSALFISYVGEYDYSNAYWETAVGLNGTDGLITLKTTIDADSNNPPAAVGATGAILTVNGKVVIQNKEGGTIVTLGDGTEIKGCAGGYIEEITLVINPENGRATLTLDQTAANAVNGNYPKTTVIDNIALGAIGETLSVRYGTNRHTHFYVYSLSVDQENGGELETHICEYTTTVNEATCTTPEVTVKECLECGDLTETATAPVLGHTWGAWSKTDGVATRSCTVCGESQSKTVGAADNSKNLLAIGDSLTYGVNVENTINGSWARYVSDNLGMKAYHNFAVHGTEVYEWYSLLTGNEAPNKETSTEIGGLTRDALIEEIRNAGIVAFSLGSNDLIGGYVGHRSAEKVHEKLIEIIDEIHAINPDAIVVSVGYAYGIAMNEGGKHETSYQLLIDFNNLMTETLNSEAYNSFAYHVDVSNVMSDVLLMGTDTVHPTAEGHKVIADRVNLALESLDKTDKVTWENVSSYVNHFDGTTPTASVVSWGATGTGGVLTVAPSTNKDENQIGVGSVAFPGKTVVTFKFNIPELPESGTVNIFHDRTLGQNYICVFSQVNEETQKTEFWASVGNDNAGNSVVKIEENTWYDVTILFAEDASAFSRVYIGNTFVGTVAGNTIGRQAGWGFANFSGCSGAAAQNAATYQIDDFTASTVADDALVHAYGIQRTDTIEMKHDVRFIFSVDDIYAGESAIGMDVTVNYGDESRTKAGYETNVVFEKIYENYGNGIITADMLGGKYIAAIIVKNVPADYESVEFIISPYAVINGVKYYSKTMTATVYPEK